MAGLVDTSSRYAVSCSCTGRRQQDQSADYHNHKYKAPLKILLHECLILDYGSADSIVVVGPG